MIEKDTFKKENRETDDRHGTESKMRNQIRGKNLIEK